MTQRLLCSKCRVEKAADCFSPKLWIVSHYYTTDGGRVETRAPCKRGRHYQCNDCRAATARARTRARKKPGRGGKCLPIPPFQGPPKNP